MWFYMANEGGNPKAAKEMAKSASEISDSALAAAQRMAQTCIKREFQGCE
jgi:uncharacterized protein YjeT (DUF2065 family)